MIKNGDFFNMRTDLAIESPSFLPTHPIEREKFKICQRHLEKNFIKIETEEEKIKSGRPKGVYITLSFRDLMKYDDCRAWKQRNYK